MSSRKRFKCTALLLCHDVIHDAKTGNVHLIGVGNKLRPDFYPARTSEICAFAVLFGVEDMDTVLLICGDANDNDIFVTPVHRIESPGMNDHRVTFRVRDAVSPRAGTYRVQCCVNEFLVSEIRIFLPALKDTQP